jgi:hypothetical protein
MNRRIRHIIRKRKHIRFIHSIICDLHNDIFSAVLSGVTVNEKGVLTNRAKLIKKYSRRLALLNY